MYIYIHIHIHTHTDTHTHTYTVCVCVCVQYARASSTRSAEQGGVASLGSAPRKVAPTRPRDCGAVLSRGERIQGAVVAVQDALLGAVVAHNALRGVSHSAAASLRVGTGSSGQGKLDLLTGRHSRKLTYMDATSGLLRTSTTGAWVVLPVHDRAACARG